MTHQEFTVIGLVISAIVAVWGAAKVVLPWIGNFLSESKKAADERIKELEMRNAEVAEKVTNALVVAAAENAESRAVIASNTAALVEFRNELRGQLEDTRFVVYNRLPCIAVTPGGPSANTVKEVSNDPR